eukprot:TCONS_00067960-protein
MMCQQCDTSDIPEDGVALAGSESDQARLGPIGAVDTSQSAGLSYDYRYQAQQGGYYDGSYGNGYLDTYGQYSYRKRRSLRQKPGRPTIVQLSPNAKVHTKIVQYAPTLRGIEKHLHYTIVRGDSTLFGLNQDKRGRTYVETLASLPKGIYDLMISGKLKDLDGYSDAERQAFMDKFSDMGFRSKYQVQVR